MWKPNRVNDTICAVITPPGKGGVSVIRVSGNCSSELVRKVCPFLPSTLESHRVYYGYARAVTDKNERLDEVLVAYFGKGRSYTGEDVFEVSCHGSPIVSAGILGELVESGAKVAERGEFTFLAFINGRIDLIQSEGVIIII